jgi:hypothetical protein
MPNMDVLLGIAGVTGPVLLIISLPPTREEAIQGPFRDGVRETHSRTQLVGTFRRFLHGRLSFSLYIFLAVKSNIANNDRNPAI